MHRVRSIVVRIVYLASIICLYGVGVSPQSHGEVVDATWNGGTGNWNNPIMWDTYPVVPNNGTNRYNVFIDGSKTGINSVVTVNGATIDTLTINQGDSLIINNNSDLSVLLGAITNNGILDINSTGNSTYLLISGATTLSGTGAIRMGNNAHNYIQGTSSSAVLTNDTMHTISGAGQLGNNGLGLVNKGTIDANQPNVLTIDPNAADVTNLGTMQASGGGTLQLAGGTFTNTNGVIRALKDSNVQLSNGATIVDGTFAVEDNGFFQVINYSSATLSGTITNNAPLQINSAGNSTLVMISGATTLSGTGAIRMGNNAHNYIQGTSSSAVLTNDTMHTISGAGQLGNNGLGLVNKGTIDANQPNVLTIDPNAADVTNLGTMQASGGGTLQLAGGTFTNTNGVIRALKDSNVQLSNGATIVDGTFAVEDNGFFQVINSSSATLSGTITNNAPLQINSAGNSTLVMISGATTLSGTGAIRMGNNAHNYIQGTSSSAVLTNDTMHTISGAGKLGNNGLGLVNKGTIDANQPNVLTIDPNAAGVTNLGTMQASGGGTLQLAGGTFTNTDGIIQALDGSIVQLLDGSTVVGGTFESTESGIIEVPNWHSSVRIGTITNNGILEVHSTGNSTSLLINGDLIGSGSTFITGVGILTANSIRQNILSIGTGSTMSIQPLEGGPLGSGSISQVPEPTAVILLGCGILGLIGYYLIRRRTHFVFSFQSSN